MKKIYICDSSFDDTACGEVFTNFNTFKSHKRGFHNNPTRIWKCKHCCPEITIKNYIAFKNHLRDVHPNNKYNCSLCDKTYKLLCVRNKHLLTHGERTYYKCILCDKKYLEKTALNNHIQIIHNDKREICDICNAVFLHKITLNAHKRIHNGTLFKCIYENCDKSYITNTVLQEHIKVVHLNIKTNFFEIRLKRL